jgi:hypothetical protein
MLDSLRRGEAPFLSHLLYPQVLNEDKPEERKQGIEAGLAWGEAAEKTVVYLDRGLTDGMMQGLIEASIKRRRIEIRSLKHKLRSAEEIIMEHDEMEEAGKDAHP